MDKDFKEYMEFKEYKTIPLAIKTIVLNSSSDFRSATPCVLVLLKLSKLQNCEVEQKK